MKRRNCRRGFTLLEALVVLAVVLVGLVIVGAFVLNVNRRPAATHFNMKDSSQVRGVMQAMTLWAQNNGGTYPLPSLLDVNDATVPEQGAAKNTSANIYSMLIWHGLATVDLLASPVEQGNVKKYKGYELSNPQAAVDPSRAQWDPAFRADFTGTEPGGVSYAHMLPGGARAATWANTFRATEVLISNRGPLVNGVTYNANGSIASVDADKNSVTYRFYTPDDTWTGNIGYNDNHVKFEQSMSPEEVSYLTGSRAVRADVIFYDEPVDPGGMNAFLSIFVTAGETREAFRAIWD